MRMVRQTRAIVPEQLFIFFYFLVEQISICRAQSMNYSLIVLQQVELNNRITFIYHLLFTNELGMNTQKKKQTTTTKMLNQGQRSIVPQNLLDEMCLVHLGSWDGQQEIVMMRRHPMLQQQHLLFKTTHHKHVIIFTRHVGRQLFFQHSWIDLFLL